MTLRITFKTVADFKRIFDITKALSMPVTIIPEEERVLTLGIDAPRVVAVRISIPEGELLEYEVDEDYLKLSRDKRAIMLDHKAVNPILKKAKKGEPISIILMDDGRVRIEAGDKRKIRMTMAPINYDLMEIPEEPFSMEYGGTIRLYGKVLKDALSTIKDVGGEFYVMAGEDALKFWSENETSRLDYEVPYDDPHIIEVEAEPETRGLYGTGYVLSVLKSVEAGDVVTMEFGEEQPLKLDIPMGENGRFTVLIAPRVENTE